MKKIKKLLEYKCVISTAFLYLLVKTKSIDKNIAVESIRRHKAKRLEKRYKTTIEKCAKNKTVSNSFEKTIWTCWFQGENSAPPIVKSCLKSIREKANDWDIIVITRENIKEYVKIPDFLIEKWQKGIISNTHFSDILRCTLLLEHGGLWIDSTCFMTDEIPSYITNNTMFCFKHKYRNEDTIELGSWFLFSKKKNPLLSMVFELEKEYWKNNDSLDDYFLFHIFFYISKKYYEEIWNFMPSLNDINPHELNRIAKKKYDDSEYRILTKLSFVHKMTYKVSETIRGSYFDVLIKMGIEDEEK